MLSRFIILLIFSLMTEEVRSIWTSVHGVTKYKWTYPIGACYEGQKMDKKEAEFLVVYYTENIMLRCDICGTTNEADIYWSYTKETNGVLKRLGYTKHMILYSNGNLEIFDVRSEDGGLYVCNVDGIEGVYNYLEILHQHENPLTKVKPKQAKRGEEPAQPIKLPNMEITTKWSQWSLCSSCLENVVGVRYCIGTCHIKTEQPIIIGDMVLSEGIPCHSKLLPQQYKNVKEVTNWKNEIMTGLCQMACLDNVKLKTTDGWDITIHTNMLTMYGIPDDIPAGFHHPERLNVHALEGDDLKIQCHGHMLSEVTKKWTMGSDVRDTIRQEPYYVKKIPRIRVTERQVLVIDNAEELDSGTYNCWKLDELVCHVDLRVHSKHIMERKVITVMSVIICVLVAAVIIYCNIRIFMLHLKLKKMEEK